MSELPDGFSGKILALCGGVGGAKLAWGLAQVLPPEQLVIAVNTGDDFEHLGLHISPDIDTVMYTLAGLNNRELGWGLQDETWQCMQALETLGSETWFRLGDRDLATHLERSRLLARGVSLSEVTRQLCLQLGVRHSVIPMSDDPVRTRVKTDIGELAFQDYFVRHQCGPRVSGVEFSGAKSAQMSAGLRAALQDPDLGAVIVCPSNPLLSIAPILAVPGVRECLQSLAVPVIVVSPLVSGKAVKGPTAKMMAELAMPCDSGSIAAYYRDIAGVLVIDECDAAEANQPGFVVHACKTLMKTDADKRYLAEALLGILST